jgi:hypothetical protein
MKIAISIEDRYADWRSESPEKLRQFAALWEGAIQDEHAGDFDWCFVEEFPLERIGDNITDTPSTWASWMKGEIAMWADEGQPDRYADMFDQDIDEPVVVHVDAGGKGHIWDGCHRVGACAMRGLASIHAVVGVRREIPDVQNKA